MEGFLAEHKIIKPLPAGNIDANYATSRVSMVNNLRCAFILDLGASLEADVTINLLQHNAKVSGDTLPLTIDNPYFVKPVDAAIAKRYELDFLAEVSTLTITDLATKAGLVIVEVLAEDLDTNAGFTHVSLAMVDGAVAKTVTALAIVTPKSKPAYLLAE